MMQSHLCKNPKGRKFADGRLKLSTSCTECHRRKQRCDQQQPCRNCVRRYPQPQCIYRNQPVSTHNSTKAVLPDNRATISLSRAGEGHNSNSGRTVVQKEGIPVVTNNAGIIHPTVKPPNSIADGLNFLDFLDSVYTYQELLTDMAYSAENRVSSPESQVPKTLKEIGYSTAETKRIQHLQAMARYNPLVDYGPPGKLGSNMMDPLHFLPVTPNWQNAELFHGFIKIIAKHVSSIDGKPHPNYYNDKWLPWGAKVPIMLQVALFTTSCYQAELQRILPAQSPIVIGLKVKAIEALNKMLRDEQTSTLDETLASVVYLTTNEWYFGSDENVQGHTRGLRELVRLKGGLDGPMHTFLRHMIILCDYHITSSNNVSPKFPHLFSQPKSVSINLDSPLLNTHQRFTANVEELRICQETAQILDDVRFITTSVLNLPLCGSLNYDHATEKLLAASDWALKRVASLPVIAMTTTTSYDYIYTSVRFAALIYLEAITKRTALGQICGVQELNMLFGSMWKVTLTEWRHIPGVFIWIMLATIEASRYAPHGRLLKSMLKTASFHLAACGSNGWEIVDSMLGRFADLQRWLREEDKVIAIASHVGKRAVEHKQQYRARADYDVEENVNPMTYRTENQEKISTTELSISAADVSAYSYQTQAATS